MNTPDAQQLFFQHIKHKIPPNLSLVDEVADLLSISNDSAYRRIRGEKPIGFDEIQKLCNHYKISLDRFFNLKNDSYIFSGKLKGEEEDPLLSYLQNVEQNFKAFNSFEKKHLYLMMKDLPLLAHFHLPELARFKCFFWMKSILHYADLKNEKFYLDDPRYDRFDEIGKKIIDVFNRTPMTEIWNPESINSSLRQIDFYHQSGIFKNDQEVKLLYNKLEELVNHLEKQAEHGVKFAINGSPENSAVSYKVFINEMVIGDNTYFAELDNIRMTFLNHSVLYFIATQDESFNQAIYDNIKNLMQRSTLISGVSEKERVRFFNILREKIHAKVARLR